MPGAKKAWNKFVDAGTKLGSDIEYDINMAGPEGQFRKDYIRYRVAEQHLHQNKTNKNNVVIQLGDGEIIVVDKSQILTPVRKPTRRRRKSTW
jgi:hypothetical protein